MSRRTPVHMSLFARLSALLPLVLAACPESDDLPTSTMATISAGDSASSGGSTVAGAETSTGQDVSTGSETATETATSDATGSTGASTSDDSSTTGTPPAAEPVACGGKIWECGDGIDNDGDGAIDGGDKECTSPCDDREDSLQTSLPGMAEDCKNDCFWDAESGVGNDGCEYKLQCDPMNPGAQLGCEFDAPCDAKITDKCLDVCAPLAPNGCDCFGCCHVATPNGTLDLYLDSSPECSFANLDACEQCTFQEGCQNPCEADKCEICFGEDGPPDGCGEPTCEGGFQACTVSEGGVHDCDPGYYCITGCCFPITP